MFHFALLGSIADDTSILYDDKGLSDAASVEISILLNRRSYIAAMSARTDGLYSNAHETSSLRLAGVKPAIMSITRERTSFGEVPDIRFIERNASSSCRTSDDAVFVLPILFLQEKIVHLSSISQNSLFGDTEEVLQISHSQ